MRSESLSVSKKENAKMAVRVTETANELTNELDAVGAEGIVRLLRQTDQQLFAGWGAHQSVYDLVRSSSPPLHHASPPDPLEHIRATH
jgi:hypothetical protein